jgi:adenylate cyclase
MCAARLNGCSAVELLDTRSVDMRLRLRGAQPASSDVVVVAVDDASIEKIGRWPWSRSTMARLLDAIAAAKPAVIGFDIVQSEASVDPVVRGLRNRIDGIDEATWSKVRASLARWSEEDLLLAESIERAGNVVLGYFLTDRATEGSDVRAPGYTVAGRAGGERGLSRIPLAAGAVTNLPELTRAAAGVGYFDVYPDVDGVFRRVAMAARLQGEVATPLSMALVRIYDRAPSPVLRVASFGAENITVGNRRVPIDEQGRLLLNYSGPHGSFRHLRASDVLAGTVEPRELRGKIVLVGVTASAVADIRATPFDPLLPGVDIHATAIDNMLRGSYLTQPDFLIAVETAVVLVASVMLGLILRRARGLAGALTAGWLIVVYLAVTQWLFTAMGLAFSVGFPIVSILLIYIAVGVQQFAVEHNEKRQVREVFSRYVSPEIAKQVSEQPDVLRLGGERRTLTVLFCDLRGFTSIAEHLAPERLVELLNEYLGAMSDVVLAHDGTLDKYIGDAVMAFWGAPVAHEDDALKACAAAIEMVERCAALQTRWQAAGGPQLEIGIGIHTGEMVVGNMGSERRLAYTVVGDAVNLGSRLEGLTKRYGVSILATEQTLALARERVVAREVDIVRVRGRTRPVRVFEILGADRERDRWSLLTERFAQGLEAYRARNWARARVAFEDVLRARPGDGPARLYLSRCEVYATSAPSTLWDGVAAD